jgi:hypothetical protein
MRKEVARKIGTEDISPAAGGDGGEETDLRSWSRREMTRMNWTSRHDKRAR